MCLYIFLDKNFLGENFKIGTKFKFGEGVNPLGEGIINEILNFDD